jgi:O-antigen ligase
LLLQWLPSRWAFAGVQIGLSLLAGAWLVRAASGAGSVRLDWILVAPAGAALLGGLQLALGTSVYAWATEQAVLDWFFRFLACLLALSWFQAPEHRERALAALLWFGFLLAVIATAQRFTAPGRVFWLVDCGVPTAMGPFVYYNQYAAFMETVLPPALAGVLERRDRAWLYALMAAVIIASVAAAGSRAGTALLAAETLAALLVSRRHTRVSWRRLAPPAAAVMALAVGLAAAMGWSPLLSKLARPDPWGERRHLTLASLEMLRDRPGFGFGLGTWPVAYPAYARFDDGLFDNQAHNDWAQWAAEGGLPLLLLMAGLGATVIRRAAGSIQWIGLAAVLAHAWVDYPFQQRPALGYHWFALAGLLAAGRRQ